MTDSPWSCHICIPLPCFVECKVIFIWEGAGCKDCCLRQVSACNETWCLVYLGLELHQDHCLLALPGCPNIKILLCMQWPELPLHNGLDALQNCHLSPGYIMFQLSLMSFYGGALCGAVVWAPVPHCVWVLVQDYLPTFFLPIPTKVKK